MNIKIVLEYDGSNFAGWQQQAKGRTVEAELKRALREITGKDHLVHAAGRTDAGAGRVPSPLGGVTRPVVQLGPSDAWSGLPALLLSAPGDPPQARFQVPPPTVAEILYRI